MTWVFGIVLALVVIAGLTAVTVMVCARWMRHVARRVGLAENRPSSKPVRGDLWLADQEMRKWLNDRNREGSE